MMLQKKMIIKYCDANIFLEITKYCFCKIYKKTCFHLFQNHPKNSVFWGYPFLGRFSKNKIGNETTSPAWAKSARSRFENLGPSGRAEDSIIILLWIFPTLLEKCVFCVFLCFVNITKWYFLLLLLFYNIIFDHNKIWYLLFCYHKLLTTFVDNIFCAQYFITATNCMWQYL